MTRQHRAAKRHQRQTDDTWVTVPFAASHLGRSRQTIYAMVTRNELDGDHIAGRLVIRRASLHAKKPILTAATEGL